MDKGWGVLHSPLLLPICATCDPRHNLWQLDTTMNTLNGQGGSFWSGYTFIAPPP